MSHSDFSTWIRARGAEDIVHVPEKRATQFAFGGKLWICSEKKRQQMTRELADGYEMEYCLALYCETTSAHVFN